MGGRGKGRRGGGREGANDTHLDRLVLLAKFPYTRARAHSRCIFFPCVAPKLRDPFSPAPSPTFFLARSSRMALLQVCRILRTCGSV